LSFTWSSTTSTGMAVPNCVATNFSGCQGICEEIESHKLGELFMI